MKKIFAIAWKDTLMRFTGWSEMALLPHPADRLYARPGRRDRRQQRQPRPAGGRGPGQFAPFRGPGGCAGKFPGRPPRPADPCQGRDPVLTAQRFGGADHPGRVRPGPSRAGQHSARTAPAAQ